MLRRIFTFFALLAMGSLDAVVAAAGAPSLARRPAELRDPAAQAVPQTAPAPATVPADPALVIQLQRLVEQADVANQSFSTALSGHVARVSAGKGAAVANEAWVVGQNAISALDSLRYESVASLAALDSLWADRMRSDALADVAALQPARSRLLAMVDAQNDQLDRLKAQLKAP
jgi:hypothetical protein